VRRSFYLHLCLVIFLSAASAVVWLLMKGETINGDEAVIGLMALKISEGSDFPIFYWKAHYSGPIASYLAAPLHLLWEPSARLLHAVLLPLHIFYACGTYLLARKWLNAEYAFLVGLFAALPAQLFPYTPLGGYTEAMAFIPWIFLFCLGNEDDIHKQGAGIARFFIGGFLSGFALWIFPISFPAVLVCLAFLYRDRRRKVFRTALVGCVVGLLPVLYYNLANPGATFLRLFSRPIGIERAALVSMVENESPLSLLSKLLTFWFNAVWKTLTSLPRFTFDLVGLGQPALAVEYPAGLLSLFALFAGLWFCLRWKGSKVMPLSLALMVLLNYAFVLFFGMDRWRYLIPVLMMVPFGLALCIHIWARTFRARSITVVVLLILLINLLSAFGNKNHNPPDYEGLARFMEDKGLTRGYADYFAAYSVVYLSHERLIYSPAFHSASVDRYPPYTAVVSHASNPAFVFAGKQEADLFRQRLKQLNFSFKEEGWERFTIFYHLSPMPDLKNLELEH
jgi:hypothetical protein